MKINIEVDEKQARIIIDALDLYSRVGCGDIDEAWKIYVRNNFKILNDGDGKVFGILESMIHAFQGNIRKESIIGVNAPRNFQVAYDIQSVLRHAIAWKNEPQGGVFVDFDKPFHVVKEQELPKVSFKE